MTFPAEYRALPFPVSENLAQPLYPGSFMRPAAHVSTRAGLCSRASKCSSSLQLSTSRLAGLYMASSKISTSCTTKWGSLHVTATRVAPSRTTQVMQPATARHGYVAHVPDPVTHSLMAAQSRFLLLTMFSFLYCRICFYFPRLRFRPNLTNSFSWSKPRPSTPNAKGVHVCIITILDSSFSPIL